MWMPLRRTLGSGLGCGSRNSQVTLAWKINANVTFAIKCCQSREELHCNLVELPSSIQHSSEWRTPGPGTAHPYAPSPTLHPATQRPRKSHLLTDLWSHPCSGLYLLSFWRNHFKSKCFQKAPLTQSSRTLTRILRWQWLVDKWQQVYLHICP